MSCSGSKWFNPAQVFAQFTTSGDKEGGNSTTSRHGQKINQEEARRIEDFNANKREIQITESAEISLPPDKAKVSIICANSKETVDDVKTSVNRRVDYILHTLKSYHIKENSYKINRILSRLDNAYRYEVEIVVEFVDFLKCEEICNILVEKLDETVRVASPVFFHSSSKLESLRCQACVSAVKNAKNKALQVVQLFNQILGPPITIKEDRYEEYVGPVSGHIHSDNDKQDGHVQSYSDKITMATVTVCVKVFVVFEIKEKAKIHRRKK